MANAVRHHPRWLYVLAWPVIGLILFSLGTASEERTIATRERTAPAVITAHDPSNHDTYEFTFTVDGRTYRQSEQSPHTSSPLHVGERVTIYYDPTDPTRSELEEFAEGAGWDEGVAALPIAGVVVLVVLVERSVYRTNRRSGADAAGQVTRDATSAAPPPSA